MRRLTAIILALALALALGGAAEELSDEARFKIDNEILNGQMALDGEHFYREIAIPEDNNVVYVELNELLEILESGTGAIYFGFPECPWCRTLMPVLFEAMQTTGYDGDIYYCNCPEQRDAMRLNEAGEIVTISEGSADYYKLLEMLHDYIGPYAGLGDESIKRLYFPTTVFLKDGQPLYVHLVTVDSQESGYDELTEEQYAELLEALQTGFNMLKTE